MASESTKEELIKSFDPNAPGLKNANIFGLPFSAENASIILFPVPWEVTVSYSAGTANGPAAILDASLQVDLFDEDMGAPWKAGIFMEKISSKCRKKSDKFRKLAEKYIAALEEGRDPEEEKDLKVIRKQINSGCEEMTNWVRQTTGMLMDSGKLVGLVGGDHSTPLGYIQAISERHDDFGILHIDAHADLREEYEGFAYSHASVMNNALKLDELSSLVQVGIRDFCEQEAELMKTDKRVHVFSQRQMNNRMSEGEYWKSVCDRIIEKLPAKVYISFDIDGLDPSLCPHTGTPVADGLGYEQALYLIQTLMSSGKKIIGFDLVEVAPGPDGDDWDGNVASRLLYRLCGVLAKTAGLI